MAKVAERQIKIIHTENSINLDSLAKTLASIITDGDSNTYIDKIIANRENKKTAQQKGGEYY